MAGLTTWFNQRTIDELNDMHVEARRKTGETGIAETSDRVARSIASSVALPVANNTYGDVKPIVDTALAGEKRISWLVVRDGTGTVIYATSTAPVADKLASFDRLLSDGEKQGDVTHAKIAGTDWVYGSTMRVGETRVGGVRMGVSTEDLEADLRNSLAEANARTRAAATKAWIVSGVVLLIGIILAALQGVRLARPIRALTIQAQKIAGGDLDSRVPEDRGDELGVLARTFNLMANEISDLLREQATKVSLEKEMELARQVQQAMLPPDKLDGHGSFKIVGYCQPASSCGGDWWTYHKLSNGRMLLVLGDATGHGIHSAMIAATARGAVEALSGIDERLLTPEQVLRAIDSAIRQVGDHNVLMTAFAAVFDSTNGILHYANAGQNFPYVIKLGQTGILEDASIIAASGNPLGDRNIAVEIRRGSLQLRVGDLFLVFTDGVVERSNSTGKLFGDRRLRSTLTGQPLRDGPGLVTLRDFLVKTIDDYGEGSLPEDDITFVLCQYDPASDASAQGRGAA
ncbi:MAG: SpoIIE family protein phosphatase [Proteobacteria bacterium]|nr:SpoIIE family protein phosphatase [Pseudomonadota bacterium]